jgi:hypothetical protein
MDLGLAGKAAIVNGASQVYLATKPSNPATIPATAR